MSVASARSFLAGSDMETSTVNLSIRDNNATNMLVDMETDMEDILTLATSHLMYKIGKFLLKSMLGNGYWKI